MKDLSLEKRKRIKQLRQYSFDYSKNNKAKKIQKDLSSSINTSLDCKNFGKSFLKPDYAIEKSYSFWNHDINKDVKKLLLNSHNIKNKIFQRNSCKKKSMSSSNIYDSNSNCIFPYHSSQNSFRNNKKYKNNSQYKLDILKKKMNEKNFSIDKKKKKYLNNKNNDTITILNYRNKIISNSFSKSNITNFHHYNFKNENNSLLNIFKHKNYYFNTMKKS